MNGPRTEWAASWRPGNRGRWPGLVLAAALALALAAPARAAEWRVPSAAAPTAAAALRQARDGDRIRIAPGTYRERLVVTKRVALIGEGGGAPPTLDGGGEGHVIDLHVPGIEVRGLRIVGSGDDLSHSDACLYVQGEASGARIHGNLFEDCAFGIWVNGTADVEIVDNRLSGRPKRLVSDRGNGINLWQIRNGLIRGNAIERVRDGIYLSVTSASRVEGNRMRDLRFGVHYMYSDHNDVVGNLTCDSQIGMALMFSKNLHIQDNVMLRNKEYGILFRTIYDSEITGNRAEGNGTGLMVNDSGYNRIERNWVSGNTIGVHVTAGNEENRVTDNAFLHNAAQVSYGMNDPIYWDDGARGNYWGGYLGWDLDHDGIGDRPYQASGTMDRLVYRYPELKLLAASPVLLMLQWVEAKFPVARAPSIVDRYPLMVPPAAAAPQGETPVAGPDAAFCERGERALAARGDVP